MSTVADELAIRNLVAGYADALHRRDAQAWGDDWAEDAKWIMPSSPETPMKKLEFSGRETIRSVWVRAMSGFPVVHHIYHSGQITFADQTAGRWYVSEYMTDADGGAWRIFGVYEDKYTQKDGRWLFAERDFTVLFRGPAEAEGVSYPHPQAVGF